MRRGLVRTACSLLLSLTIGFLGCGLEIGHLEHPQSPAKLRAANEFDCPYDELIVVQRPDLSANTVDISGCGHSGRYTCFWSYHRWQTCVREPME